MQPQNDPVPGAAPTVIDAAAAAASAEAIARHSSELFKPDFNVYADRGSNCVNWD